jgi:hypothetical protein
MDTQIFLNGITTQQLAEAIAKLLYSKDVTKDVENIEPNTESSNDLVTRLQVCQLLSINKTSLWKHTKSGKLKSYGIGNRVYYKRSEVLAAVKPINH